MTATSDGGGYWLVACDGGVFAFGDAGYFGSMGGRALVKPMVGMAAAPNGDGYWTVASDGGVFAFGGAGYFGSMGGRPLAATGGRAWPPPPTAAATGWWLRTAGCSPSVTPGSQGRWAGRRLAQPVVAMAAAAPGGGYWLVASDGGIFAFGGAGFFGSMGGRPLSRPVVGMTPDVDGPGLLGGGSATAGSSPSATRPSRGPRAGPDWSAPMVGIAAPPLP